MQYNLETPIDRERFLARCEYLLDKGSVVEMTERSFRSPNQNRYLHLCIGVVAMETGVTLEYAKSQYFKRLVNPDVFVVVKEDAFVGSVEALRSTTDLTKEEMSICLDKFKIWASSNGIYIPNPGDESLLREIEIQMGRMKQYL